MQNWEGSIDKLIRRLGRISGGPLIAVLALLGSVPLVFFVHSLRLTSRAVDEEVKARLRATAAGTSESIEEEMEGLAEVVNSYAHRPSLVEALVEGDRADLRTHLAELRGVRDHIDAVFVATSEGKLLNVLPPTPPIVGDDFSYRDWYKGVTASGRPYISEAYWSRAAGRPRVVAAAAPVPAAPVGRGSHWAGILVATYSLEAIQSFAHDFARAQKADITVTDQRGTVLAASGKSPSGLVSRSDDPGVAGALKGRTGVTRRPGPDGGALSAYAPVSGIGWTVNASVPVKAAFATVSSLRSALRGTSLLVGVVMICGVALVVLNIRGHIRMQKFLEKSEARTRSILKAAEDAYIEMDSKGVITDWNQRAEATFGWPRDEVVGRRVSETIVPPEQRFAHERGLQRFRETGAGPILHKRIEITALHRDGNFLPVELAVWPTEIDGVASFSAFVQDISERKRTQEELAAAHEKATEASRMKSQFLANMSHEIRTPMNGVIGMAGLLLETELSAEQREYAEAVRRSSDALLTVINEILDFSKIEAGRMELEVVDFDLRTVVEEVSALLAEQAHPKGLELVTLIHPDVPVAVRGDPHRVRQVLMNLVGNAVKFTESGEVVASVRVQRGDDESSIFRFDISDTGVGLDPQDLDRLFESFSQADSSSTRRHGGTGLGLAISKQLVELMGGEIGVDSTPGEGSRFWFTTRFGKGSRTNRIVPVPAETLDGLRVLVVDDNATNRTLLEENLESWRMVPALTENAEQALEVLRARAAAGAPFDLALLDFNMPGMDGVELAKAIASDAVLSETRLILLTSMIERDPTAAQAAGIEAYLTKPIRQSALLDCIATVVGLGDKEGPKPMVTHQTVKEAKAGARAHILVAEDNLVNQKVAVRMLEKLDYRIDVASTGADAVEAVERNQQYAAILMDCRMPEMDGYEATQAIRKLPDPLNRTPIIAMTAGAMKSDEERARAAGMDDYIAKPVKMEDLRATLEQWVKPTQPDEGAREREKAVNSPPLDESIISRLRELDDGGGGVSELVELFIHDTKTNLNGMRRAVAENDMETASALAHGLKGSAGNFGAATLTQLCTEIEERVGAGQMSRAVTLAEEIEAEFDRVCSALRTTFSLPAEPAHPNS